MQTLETRFSKALSHALRHEPWLYELELDDDGWAPVEDVLRAFRMEYPELSDISEADVVRIIAASPKRRHEISNGRVRALYGHSFSGKLKKTPAVPPTCLYHGTSPESVPCICHAGLLPMGRQYVHLSITEAIASEVGRRKSKNPTILCVFGREAHANGITFYEGNEQVWLADGVPPQFISFNELGGLAEDPWGRT